MDNEKQPAWQIKGLTDKQINKIAIYADEFTSANSKLMSPSFKGDYNDLINLWRPMLKDPTQVIKFAKRFKSYWIEKNKINLKFFRSSF